jgi:Pyridoxamine 5'-phosphate oxidase
MRVIEPDIVTFLESGCALIVGSVGADGRPAASRGWGLTVIDAERPELRLLLDAEDDQTVANLSVADAPVAVTGADVPTFRSVQLKGRVVAVEPADAADRARAVRFMEAFFTDITNTDGTPRPLLEHLVPSGFVASTVRVDDLFDQTPGPTAGTPLDDDGS